MPCQSDYLEPEVREKESYMVCKHLVYMADKLGLQLETRIKTASTNIYGDYLRLDEDTAKLCSLLKNLSAADMNRIVYDARNPSARNLADWWEQHQEADRKREAKEATMQQQEQLRKQAISKLTTEERKAIGLE